MAIPFLNSLDLNKNELLNAAIQNLSTPPVSPVDGQIYYDTDDQRTWQYSATLVGWVQIPGNSTVTPAAETINASGVTGVSVDAARADHIHAMPPLASTGVDGFMTGSDKDKLDAATSSPTATTLVYRDAFGRAQVVSPSAGQDIANKDYVDAVASTGNNKGTARAATTATLALTSATTTSITNSGGLPSTLDGATLATDDIILVKDEVGAGSTNAPANGLYIYAAGTTWLRATDADTDAEVKAGLFVFVSEGTANGDNGYTLTTDNPITVGTTELLFTQTSGAGQITAGAGLTKTSNTLDVGQGTGIVVNANDVAIDTAVVVRKYSETFGDGIATSFVITHNLGTRDVTVQVYQTGSPYAQTFVDIEATTTNTVTVRFSVAPATNTYRVTIHA